jgi:predicted metal-dependent hydrolase
LTIENDELRIVNFEETQIEYIFIRKQVKNINLRIKPEGKIIVSANLFVSANKIDEFVISKGKYILKALEKYKELQKYSQKPKQYISGESFTLLSRDLRLKVLEGAKESIDADGIYIFLTVKDKEDYKGKSALVNRWISNQCKVVFEEIVGEVYVKFQKYGVKTPQIRLRDMKSRWGSCQPKRGIITLNTRLIEAPRNCIEYVVLHEFCHFIQPNHSKKFYAFVQMLMPDWKERKKVLESQEYHISDTVTE